jgi:hypothetical protein
MAKVQHYKGLGTNLESLYDSMKAELESEKNLQIVSEYKGERMTFRCEVSSPSIDH